MPVPPPVLVGRLRAAGCVFAEDEAAALVAAAPAAWRRERLVRRRVAGEPLEQVVGRVAFGRLRLAVAPAVFVPRQRTLLLARLAVRVARGQAAPLVVEACSGVAPVAAAVARAVPRAQVHAADLDPAALRCARRNLPPSAGLHLGHLLDALPVGLRGRVTLLAAVPPYVPDAAAGLLPREARDHEPGRALFGGPDGLAVARALVAAAGAWLTPRGRLLLEVGARQAEALATAVDEAGLTAVVHLGADGQTAVVEARRSVTQRVRVLPHR